MSDDTKVCTLQCKYDSTNDRCHTCGRTMEEIRNAFSKANSWVRQ